MNKASWLGSVRCAATLAGVAVGLSGCSDGSSEPAAKSDQGITNGDNVATHPWIVFITGPNGLCTGAVVSRAYVMTAAHCFVEGWGLAPVPLSIRNNEFGDAEINSYTPDPLRPDHVPRLLENVRNSASNYGGSRRDIALIPLDKLAPPSAAEATSDVRTTFPLPVVLHRDEFRGEYFGYGNEPFFTLAAEDPGTRPIRKRVGQGAITRKDGFWAREFDAVGTSFVGQIPGLGDLVNVVTGNENNELIEQGDSGGPLIDAEQQVTTGMLGVNSSVWPDFDCDVRFLPFPPFITAGCRIEVESHHSDASRDDIRAWYNSILQAEDGQLKGDCNRTVADRSRVDDQDGDMIPDACDPCPHQFDENYDISRTPDTDQDGLPERCDLCPTVADGLERVGGLLRQRDSDGDLMGDVCDPCASDSTRAGNCNLEAELTVGYEGLGLVEPPVIYPEASLNPFGESRDDAVARYERTFDGDACDIAPCPGFERSSASLPVDLQSGLQCIPTGTTRGLQDMCQVATGTRIKHFPKPSPPTRGLVGVVHMKWCWCPTDANRDTLEGRVSCQDSHMCLGSQSRFSDPTLWHDIRTAPDDGRPSSAYDAAETGQYPLQVSISPAREVVWNHQALGAPFLETGNSIRGVLWNNVRDVPATSPSFIPTIQARGSALSSGDVVVTREPEGDVIDLTPPFPGGFADVPPSPCWTCFEQVGNVIDRFVQRPELSLGDLRPITTPIGPSGPLRLGDARSIGALTDQTADLFRNTPSNTQPVAQAEPLLGQQRLRATGTASEGVVLVVDGIGTSVNAPAGVRVVSALTRSDAGAPLDVTPINLENRRLLFGGTARSQGQLGPLHRRSCAELQLTASRSYGTPVFADGRGAFGTQRNVVIPELVEVGLGNAGNGLATLKLTDSVTGFEESCEYRGQAGVAHPVDRDAVRQGALYALETCSSGMEAGDSLVVDGASLRVQSGDDTAGLTLVRASLHEQQPCVPQSVVPEVTISSEGSRGVSRDTCFSVELVAYGRESSAQPRVPHHPRPGTVFRISSPIGVERDELVGRQRLAAPARFVLPAEIPTSGDRADGSATLTFQSGEAGSRVTCNYDASRRHGFGHGGWSSQFGRPAFRFASCDSELRAGDVFQADALSLAVSHSGTKPSIARLKLDALGSCGTAYGPEQIADPDGVVYSASRQEVFLFGGLSSRASAARTTAWAYSLARDVWVETRLDAGARPGDVSAATYRTEDGFVYAVDFIGGKERIRRWNGVAPVFENLATLPRDWRDARFTRRWLVAAGTGDLVLVGTRADLTILVRLGVAADGRLSFLGAKRMDRGILARPIAGETGVSVSIASDGGTPQVVQQSVSYESFHSHAPRWAPSFGGH